MGHSIMPAALQDVKETHQVGINICKRVFNAVSNPCLGRQVHRNIKTLFLEDPLHAGAVRKIKLLESEPRIRRKQLKPVLFECGVIIRIYIIYAIYICPIFKETPGKVEPYETRSARDKYFHCMSSGCCIIKNSKDIETGYLINILHAQKKTFRVYRPYKHGCHPHIKGGAGIGYTVIQHEVILR
jgi:hypothetical protein